MTTRFAPSPTGHLHLGHVFAALLAFQRAQENGGEFLLRFEDIDHTRVREEYYQQIETDLRWLGITWAGSPWRQSERLPHYHEALGKLQEMGIVYPCYCTRREIEQELAELGHAPQGPEGPLYPGTCRDLSSQERNEKLFPPAWRLNTKKITHELTFHDRSAGIVQVDPTILGDVILARKDIGTSYHLAVVVDDAAQAIDLVTRGADLLPSTHIHRILQHLLDYPEPTYEHHRILCDDIGQRLAKRHESLSIATLRERGRTPAEVLAMLNP